MSWVAWLNTALAGVFVTVITVGCIIAVLKADPNDYMNLWRRR